MTELRRYPYIDGDVTVLGPEIFASLDGAVISWRGENYTRQTAPLTPCTCRQAIHALEHGGRTVPDCPWCMPTPEIRPKTGSGGIGVVETGGLL